MRTIEETEEIVNPKVALSEYLQDLPILQHDFNELARLAAKVTDMQTCLINLVDTDIQWTIGSFGSPLGQFASDESICQYTILRDIPFEVQDLSKDTRFACMKRLKESGLRYYYGIPLRSPNGSKIGALCVLDRQQTGLSASHKVVLNLLAGQAALRLEDIRKMNRLRQQLSASERLKRTLAHDIRGPLQGISALSEMGLEELNDNQHADIPVYLRHIAQSGRSLLDLTHELLADEVNPNEPESNNLKYLRDRIVRLFMPGLLNKRLSFTFKIAPEAEALPLPGAGLLRAVSNLVANAIKFTPDGGRIAVEISVKPVKKIDHLHFTITDTGTGMDERTRQDILSGRGTSSAGTAGEKGTGLGLTMVRKVVAACYGWMNVQSVPGFGTSFTIITPLEQG